MSHFVNEGEEKRVWVKVMINGDDVSILFRMRAVVAVLGRAAFRNAKMNVEMHNPVNADVHSIGRYIFGKDFMNFGVGHLGKNGKAEGKMRGGIRKVIDREAS
jgi:hypothetical protein